MRCSILRTLICLVCLLGTLKILKGQKRVNREGGDLMWGLQEREFLPEEVWAMQGLLTQEEVRMVEFGGDIQNRTFLSPKEGKSSQGFRGETTGYSWNQDLLLYGKALYGHNVERQKQWSSRRKQGLSFPMEITDSIAGDWHVEEFNLEGGVVHCLQESGLIYGVKSAYSAASSYRTMGGRPLGKSYELSINGDFLKAMAKGWYLGAHISGLFCRQDCSFSVDEGEVDVDVFNFGSLRQFQIPQQVSLLSNRLDRRDWSGGVELVRKREGCLFFLSNTISLGTRFFVSDPYRVGCMSETGKYRIDPKKEAEFHEWGDRVELGFLNKQPHLRKWLKVEGGGNEGRLYVYSEDATTEYHRFWYGAINCGLGGGESLENWSVGVKLQFEDNKVSEEITGSLMRQDLFGMVYGEKTYTLNEKVKVQLRGEGWFKDNIMKDLVIDPKTDYIPKKTIVTTSVIEPKFLMEAADLLGVGLFLKIIRNFHVSYRAFLQLGGSVENRKLEGYEKEFRGHVRVGFWF